METTTAAWCTGKQIGNRLIRLYSDFDIPLYEGKCPPATPRLQRACAELLVLLASGDRVFFKKTFLRHPVSARKAFACLIADIIGSLRKLPADWEFPCPEPSSSWLDLLKTLLLSQTPLYTASLERLQTLCESGQLRPDDQRLAERYRVQDLSLHMHTEKAAFSLESSYLDFRQARSSSPARKRKPIARRGEEC